MAAAMVMSMSLTWIGGSSWLWARRGRARAVDGSEDASPCPSPIAAGCLLCVLLNVKGKITLPYGAGQQGRKRTAKVWVWYGKQLYGPRDI